MSSYKERSSRKFSYYQPDFSGNAGLPSMNTGACISCSYNRCSIHLGWANPPVVAARRTQMQQSYSP